MSTLAQAQRIRRRELGAYELVAAYLDRIARLNPRISAFVQVLDSRARAEARRKDQRSTERAPFHGVPIAVKDLNLVRGAYARMGSRAYSWLWSPIDDLTVTALRRAGFVLMGKLSTSELALMPVVETDLHPPTRNPWSPEYSAGGSSGGSGAAVASGMLPIAQGSDGAGSIRIPAACNGLFGFKPSRGRVPNPHLRVDRMAMSAIGPLARGVEDGAALLDALCGRDPESAGSFLRASRVPPPRLRVRVVTESPVASTDPEIAAAVRRTAGLLADLGHLIEEGPPLVASIDEFLPIYQRLAASSPVLFESKLQPVTRWLRAAGRQYPEASIRRSFAELSARATAWFGDIDVLLSPTSPVPPPRVGAWEQMPPEAAFRAAAPMGAFTAMWNLTGQPAASLPVGLLRNGLPIGVQLTGRPDADERLLSLCRQLEEAAPPLRLPL